MAVSKEAAAATREASDLRSPLSLTSHLFTFYFSEHLERRADKRRLKKNGGLFSHFDLRLAAFYFPLSRTLEQRLRRDKEADCEGGIDSLLSKH